MVPFTGLGAHGGFRGDQWLKNRIDIFKEYVLPSLVLQGREFYTWFCWRKEEEWNPIVREFINYLQRVEGVYPLHTFGGIPFWDDKYDEKEASARLMKTLEVSLPELKSAVGESPYVLLTIQPSDDMYFSDAPKKLREKAKELVDSGINLAAIGWKKGYIMNYWDKEISEYMNDTTPPFFTIMMKSDVFLDPKKHYEATGPYKSHEYIVDHMPYYDLGGRGFVVGTHGENISTTYHHRYRGRVLTPEESSGVMIRTGTLESRPMRFPPSLRLRARRLVNRLPFNTKLKELYYKLPSKIRFI